MDKGRLGRVVSTRASPVLDVSWSWLILHIKVYSVLKKLLNMSWLL